MDLEQIKERSRQVWSLGDYSHLARLLEGGARALVEACEVASGQQVLDVAAGTGNVAVLAAERGAHVVASDLTPTMVEKGRARTEAAGLGVEWVEADAEDMPFEAERFDRVLSAFGVALAPRPDVAAAELFRVARPGATIGVMHWTPDGLPGRAFAVVADYLPRPEGVPSPSDEWAVEEAVRGRLEPLAATLSVERRTLTWDADPETIFRIFEQHGGPQVAARTVLPPDRYEAMREEILAAVRELSPEGGGVEAEYMLTVARKPDRS